jgi:hypothetical protein
MPQFAVIIHTELSKEPVRFTCIAKDSFEAFEKAKQAYPLWKSLMLETTMVPTIDWDFDGEQ